MINRLFIVVALMFLASCATRQDAPGDSVSQVESSGDKGDSLVETKIVTPGMLAAEKLASTEPSVYFDYDKSTIKPEFEEIIKSNFEWLINNPAVSYTHLTLPTKA